MDRFSALTSDMIVPFQELREAFEYEYMVTGRERLLLTAAVSAGKLAIDAGYEIKELAK